VKEFAMRVSKFMAALILGPATFGLVTLSGCGTSPSTPQQTAEINATAETNLQVLRNQDPSVGQAIDQAYAYAVLPEVGKGGVGVSGGGGKGVVYEQGKYWGVCQTQFGDVGLTLGGETYSELVLFRTKAAFDNFTNAGLKFDSAASATAIQAGVTVKPKFENDTALLTYNTKGLMLDASIGAQQFTAKPEKTMTGPAPKMSPTSQPGSGVSGSM
jgi:lipid-binding SYLF domain-containing protein